MRLPLTLGPLRSDGCVIRRSGVRWLQPDGYDCRANEVVALAHLSLDPKTGRAGGGAPFAEERTLQVALAPGAPGRLRIDPGARGGGYLDFFGLHDWDADEVVGHIEVEPADASTVAVSPMRRLMLAGRRMAWAVDVDAGLLPGWNLRARAWWGDDQPPSITLATVGVCDATGFVRGDQAGFSELFEAAPFPLHVTHISEHPIAPCAPILLEQFLRTPAQVQAIAADIRRALADGPVTPTPEDYIFMGAVLAQLSHSPLRETHEILGPEGLIHLPPAQAVLMSVASEPGRMLRHKTLGYAAQIYDHDLRASGPAARAWVASAFEVVNRSIDDIRADLERLVDTVHAQTGARFLIVNRMSTSGRETISSYAPFDAPLSRTLETVAAKAINLMLHDLAQTRPVDVVDVDALGAEFGGGRNLPDGIHQSGEMQQALRLEVLSKLAPA